MATAPGQPMSREDKKVIFASSLGTIFEWYDFFIYGSLAVFIGKQFFSPDLSDTSRYLIALLAFSAGFAVRPFGALVFGRLGDLVGRKYTFLITIVFMGLSTFGVGLLPSYKTIGAAAPIILIILRLIQGLALGGEYGGAATYVAEHAPAGKRGAYTSWIQATATLGLFLSLVVIVVVRSIVDEDDFAAFWWRLPFLLSIILLVVSAWIRLSLNESPAFRKMKAEGKGSKAPLTDAFGNWKNLRLVLIALFGLTAGQAVIWYGGQFYAQIFLTSVLKVPANEANILLAIALALGTPFFLVFGYLSDRIGRKKIIMAGLLLAAVTYPFIFPGITHFANPALEAAQAKSPVIVVADPDTCHFQFELFAKPGKPTFTSSCDLATSALAARSVSYTIDKAPPGTVASVKIGDKVVPSFEGEAVALAEFKPQAAALSKTLGAAISAAGYPTTADKSQINEVMVVVLLFILMIYVTMVYGPIAALLVELFPTRIRYTSMSLPYHIGNGWFGGFLPPIAVALVAAYGNIYAGLWYPIAIAVMSLVIGLIFVPETKDVDIFTN